MESLPRVRIGDCNWEYKLKSGVDDNPRTLRTAWLRGTRRTMVLVRAHKYGQSGERGRALLPTPAPRGASVTRHFSLLCALIEIAFFFLFFLSFILSTDESTFECKREASGYPFSYIYTFFLFIYARRRIQVSSRVLLKLEKSLNR